MVRVATYYNLETYQHASYMRSFITYTNGLEYLHNLLKFIFHIIIVVQLKKFVVFGIVVDI